MLLKNIINNKVVDYFISSFPEIASLVCSSFAEANSRVLITLACPNSLCIFAVSQSFVNDYSVASNLCLLAQISPMFRVLISPLRWDNNSEGVL